MIIVVANAISNSRQSAKQQFQQTIGVAKQQFAQGVGAAKAEFSGGIDGARSRLLGRKAPSKVWLLNTLSNLLEPIHYVGGIEGAVCLYLNQENCVMDVQHWVGDINSVPMPPDEITGHARAIGAASIAIAHNHPNNSPTPSDQDIWHGANLKANLESEGIRLAEDHVWCHNQYKSVLNTRRFKDLSRPV